MATKSKTKSRSRRRGTNADEVRETSDRGTRLEQRRINEAEGDISAERQRELNAQRDAAIQENDQVSIDIEGVPEALKNSALNAHLEPLNAAGAHGQSGRVARVEQTSDGIFYHVEGPTFAYRVPQAAVQRADQAQKARKKSSAKKKSAKKKSSAKKK